MPRHSDRKSKGTPLPVDPSRRSFIERVVGTGVTAPALMTLTGSWLAADPLFAQQYSSSQIAESAYSGSGSYAESSSGSSTQGPPTILHVAGDSTLRQDAPNTNEGANPFIRVSVRPVRRGIVQFDPQTLEDMRNQAAQNVTVYLTLQIASNNNNWSQDEESYVDVHPLPENFWIAEGNGKTSGMPPSAVTRGNGGGVTWNQWHDSNTSDNKKKTAKVQPRNWDGGDLVMLPATAPGQLHYNGLYGQVSWDVTQDVLSGANAWIVKIRSEYEPVQSPERRQAGYDPFRGSVDYFSKEGAAESIGCVFPPMLQVVPFNVCGGSESSQQA
jgi:hypothetical protein